MEIVLTVRSLNGDVLCTLPGVPSATARWKMIELCQAVEAHTGIPALAQKLLAGEEELNQFDELAATCSTEITLLRRSQEVMDWITKLQRNGCDAFKSAPAQIKNDPFVCLKALSIDEATTWPFVANELLRDDAFLVAALKQDADMFLHTRSLATNMDFLTGCAKLRSSGRMNWGSRGPVVSGEWSYSLR